MNTQVNFTFAVVATIVAAVLAFGVVKVMAPAVTHVTTVAQGSPAGTTFNNAKVAAVVLNPQSITSTSTSLYNGDASDRIVTDGFVYCSGLTNMFGATGAGLATFDWYAATSSAAAPTASIAGHPLAAMRVSVGTSTANGFTATSTYGAAVSRVWAAGTYMVFQTNGTSSAASCVPGLHYIAS